MSIAGSKAVKCTILAILIVIMLSCNAFANEKKQQKSYLELGVTKSLLFQPSLGYWWNRTGVRFSGMYWSKDLHVFQLDIGYAFYDEARLQQSINLVTCWVVGSDPGADYRFGATGLAYSVNYRGLFFELGLTAPWRDDIGNLANDPVVPCLSWGYIYRFLPARRR